MLIEDDNRHSGPCVQENLLGQEEKEDNAAPADTETTVGAEHTICLWNFHADIKLKSSPNLNSYVIIVALSIQ